MKNLVKCYLWGIGVYGAEIWTLRRVDQKCLGSFKMWFWRRLEKTNWTDCVRNEEVLLWVKEKRNILLHRVKGKNGNWIVISCISAICRWFNGRRWLHTASLYWFHFEGCPPPPSMRQSRCRRTLSSVCASTLDRSETWTATTGLCSGFGSTGTKFGSRVQGLFI